MTDLHWTEIDKVATVWADTPGPLKAGLLFRTGRVDEALTTTGQTHLVEHITLSSFTEPAQNFNGFVSGAITGFFTIGQPQVVADFLARVCETLQSLPADRLETEKQILAAESATRRYDFRTNQLAWRYGAAGYGLTAMPEFGLHTASLEQLRELCAKKFTRENAILWLSGPPPPNLCLQLPQGTKQPLPALTPIQWTFPSWFVDDASGGIAVGATASRVSASTIFCEIASRRLRYGLRTAKAVSYAPTVFYDPLDANTAHLILYADSNLERREELVNLFGEIFEGLGKVDDSDLDLAKQQIREQWVGSMAPPPADRMLMEVQRAATDWLYDKEYESLESLAAEMELVNTDHILSFFQEIKSTLMFAIPSRIRLQHWLGARIPPSKVPLIEGKRTTSLDAPIQTEQLVFSIDGVSVVWPNGLHFTVRYSQLAGALAYGDGGVCLIGTDATTLTIEPTLWRNGLAICKEILAKIPTNLILQQPARLANNIPKPRTTAWQRFSAHLKK